MHVWGSKDLSVISPALLDYLFQESTTFMEASEQNAKQTTVPLPLSSWQPLQSVALGCGHRFS
ncbi:rCG42213 [Rattus norvegicus]|uniref:RCG42213 n=1 Tax=Rattus norvegicus TaxID=10116 RepID=A6K099_RAT|nr:rCG42213 [Rattus norvegicus]